jgi:hypothetical protein
MGRVMVVVHVPPEQTLEPAFYYTRPGEPDFVYLAPLFVAAWTEVRRAHAMLAEQAMQALALHSCKPGGVHDLTIHFPQQPDERRGPRLGRPAASLPGNRPASILAVNRVVRRGS